MTYTLSVFDIYGTDKPKIPRGYEVVDFRPPVDGEIVLCEAGGGWEFTEKYPWPDWDKIPLLILRKKARKRRGA